MRLRWLSTLGGPHLVLPEPYAAFWEGNTAPSGGRVIQATFRCKPDLPATDYDRACSIRNSWLGVIPVGKGEALVLTGDATAAAYHRTQRGQHFILRWLYAPSETALLDHFDDMRDRLPVEEEAEFRHPGGNVLLMDSVDIPGRHWTPPVAFALPRAKYRVLTSYSKSAAVFIIVHQLRRR